MLPSNYVGCTIVASIRVTMKLNILHSQHKTHCMARKEVVWTLHSYFTFRGAAQERFVICNIMQFHAVRQSPEPHPINGGQGSEECFIIK